MKKNNSNAFWVVILTILIVAIIASVVVMIVANTNGLTFIEQIKEILNIEKTASALKLIKR